MSWTNADGLTVLMHGEQGEVNVTGATVGPLHQSVVLEITDATTLGTSYSTAAGPNDAYIPSGAVVTSAYTIVDTAFTSGGLATLSVGLYNAAGTAIDADGLDATVAVADLGANKVVAGDGALVGAEKLTANAYIGAIYGTAAFTAGAAKIVVEYILVD